MAFHHQSSEPTIKRLLSRHALALTWKHFQTDRIEVWLRELLAELALEPTGFIEREQHLEPLHAYVLLRHHWTPVYFDNAYAVRFDMWLRGRAVEKPDLEVVIDGEGQVRKGHYLLWAILYHERAVTASLVAGEKPKIREVRKPLDPLDPLEGRHWYSRIAELLAKVDVEPPTIEAIYDDWQFVLNAGTAENSPLALRRTSHATARWLIRTRSPDPAMLDEFSECATNWVNSRGPYARLHRLFVEGVVWKTHAVEFHQVANLYAYLNTWNAVRSGSNEPISWDPNQQRSLPIIL